MTESTHYNVQITIQEVVTDTVADTSHSAPRGSFVRTRREPVEVLRVNTRGTTFQLAVERARSYLEVESATDTV